ncbi:MAG: hypothetical protein ABJM26_01160 [Anderseniella sp.]
MNLHSGDETGQGKVRTKMIRGAGMDFQRGMWAEAWVQSVAAFKFVALGIVGELALEQSMEWLGDPMSPSLVVAGLLASTYVWCFLAYTIHAQILSAPDRGPARYNVRVFGFALRTIAIFVVVWGAMIGLAFVLGRIPGLREFLAVGIEVPVLGEVSRFFVGMLTMLLVVGFPLFVCLAMILPAYAADRTGSVVVAFQRGRAQFGWIAGRLLIGPFFLTALLIALIFLPAIQINDVGLFWIGDGGFKPIAFLWSVLNYAVSAFGVSLTAVILSRAFLRAEGMPDAVAA